MCRTFTALLLLLLAAPSTGAQAPATPAATLDVTVSHVPSAQGTVIIGVYATSETWMKLDRAFRQARVKAAKGSVTTSFPDLPPGRYAVSVIHDENDNAKFDMRWFPFPSPTEHGGASNNVMSRLGPPSFDKALFDVGAGGSAIVVKLWR